MPENFYLFCLVVLVAAGTLSCTVMALDYWLTKADKPRLRRPLRVRRIRRARYEPLMPKWEREFPDGRKEEAL